MAFYLGIDGGGTKTKFLLGNEQQILAETTGAGSNVVRSGEEAVHAALHSGLEEVCSAAGIDATEIQRTVAGVAGSSNEKVRDSLRAMLREKISGEVEIVGDMVIAHHAALEGVPGVLVNSGTGSIAYGRNANNETCRAGGWGFAISDEGSGHWIGREAIAAAMRSFDAAKNEEYLHHLMAAVGVHKPDELAQFATSTANPDFAEIFPAVVSIAELGDTTAQKILQRAGEELACLAKTVLDRIFAPGRRVAVAAVGGVFQSSGLVFESFREHIQISHPSSVISLSPSDPALGALMLARQTR